MAHPGFGMYGGAGQRLGSAGSFPRAGNGPVPFGSEGEHAGSFSYVHRGAVFAHPVNGSARGTAHRGRAGCREVTRWLQPGPVETRQQWGCGGISLQRGSVRDGGWRRGLPASKGDVTEVHLWLLRKMPSARPYTASGLFVWRRLIFAFPP